MAEQSLFTFTLLQDRCFSSCADADFSHLLTDAQIGVYYDDSADSIVYRDLADDSLLAAADFQPTGLPSYANYVAFSYDYVGSGNFNPLVGVSGGVPINNGDNYQSNYQFCSGNNLVTFTIPSFGEFPFVTKNTNADGSCVGGVTCDVVIESISITNETGTGNADGSATITATTSQTTLQYSLSPFEFGAGQTSNTFSGLTEGDYTVYVADDLNCKTQATFSIANQSANQYNALYRIGFNDINGNAYTFDIEEYEFGGAVTEITSGSVPVRYTLNEKDQFDIFTGIQPAYLEIEIPETSSTFDYEDLYTQDNRKYRGVLKQGGTELFRGFLDPTTFSSGYNWNRTIALTFIDGLARLSNEEYAGGEKFYNDKKLIKVVADALKTTDLELPIYCGINVYEDSHASTAADDPLDQTYLDQETFYNADDGSPRDYAEILNDMILKPFGAILRQWNGAWWILRVEELQDSFDYRAFDVNGDYTSNGTFSSGRVYHRRPCITDARATFAEGSQNREQLKPANNFNVTFELDKRDSILENYSFERNDQLAFKARYWTATLGGATQLSGVNINESFTASGNNSFQFEFQGDDDFSGTYVQALQKNIQYEQGDKFKISFKTAANVDRVIPYLIIRFEAKLGSNYLQEDRTWDTTQALYREYVTPGEGFQDIDLTVDFPQAAGRKDETFDLKIYAFYLKSFDFGYLDDIGFTDGETTFRAADTTSAKGNRIVSVWSQSLEGGARYIYYYRLEEGSDAESLPDVVRPNDYATSTNEKVYRLEKKIYAGGTNFGDLAVNDLHLIDDVVIDVLPNGREARKEYQIKTANTTGTFIDDYDITLKAGDLPDPSLLYISSAKYIYNNFYKLSDGTNTQNWTRDGQAESQTIQQVLAKQIVRQYTTPTNKLSGVLTTNNEGTHEDITPLSHIVETQDGGKIYYINSLSIDFKSLSHDVNLIHSKASTTFPAAVGVCEGNNGQDAGGTDDDGGTGTSYNGDFNADFGSSFDTIFN